MIVLNGEPFLRYNLRSIYPYAHQIILVEGASPAAKAIATSDGHSTDETLDTIMRFIHEEDPENKIQLVTAEDEGHPDGFWLGEKDEQSRAYAKRATGNYLWQVDSDEFYRVEEVEQLLSYLEAHPEVTAVSFPMITFWGDPYTWVDSWYLRRGASTYHRLFKWGPGYRYATHRPPTVVDDLGRDTRRVQWLDSSDLKKMGVYLYHYSLLFPRQVYEKCRYYADSNILKRLHAVQWYEQDFMQLRRPFRLHNVYQYPGWLERWTAYRPEQIDYMWNDITKGVIDEEIRKMDDANRLLKSQTYRICVELYKLLDVLDRRFHRRAKRIKSLISKIFIRVKGIFKK